MLSGLLIVAVLVAVTVLVNATGFALLLRSLIKSHAQPSTQTWPIAWLLIRLTWCLLLSQTTLLGSDGKKFTVKAGPKWLPFGSKSHNK